MEVFLKQAAVRLADQLFKGLGQLKASGTFDPVHFHLYRLTIDGNDELLHDLSPLGYLSQHQLYRSRINPFFLNQGKASSSGLMKNLPVGVSSQNRSHRFPDLL